MVTQYCIFPYAKSYDDNDDNGDDNICIKRSACNPDHDAAYSVGAMSKQRMNCADAIVIDSVDLAATISVRHMTSEWGSRQVWQ